VAVAQRLLMEGFVLNKYRIQFTKGDQIRFVPHLDMVRLFQRAIRRANLPIAYSQGFNPHQQMSFAQPLSVGATGIAEYIDIETTQLMDTKDAADKINTVLPEGAFVTNIREVREKEKNGMAAVEAGSYIITLDRNVENLQNSIDKFLSEPELIIEKKSKKVTKEVNIRADIFKLEAIEDNKMYAFLATGSNRNLKPDLMLECFYKYMGLDFNPYKMGYDRQDVFTLDGEAFVSLGK
jgi:radical SAM-linked protein